MPLLPILILLVIVLVVLIWQGLATYRAKANILREETYRKLAEKVAATGEKSLETQQKTVEVLDEVRTRLVSYDPGGLVIDIRIRPIELA